MNREDAERLLSRAVYFLEEADEYPPDWRTLAYGPIFPLDESSEDEPGRVKLATQADTPIGRIWIQVEIEVDGEDKEQE